MREKDILKALDDYSNQIAKITKNVKKRNDKTSDEQLDGTLKYHKSATGKYYYSVRFKNPSKEQYLKKGTEVIAAKIAQHEYDESFLKKSKKINDTILICRKIIESNSLEHIYINSSDAKRKLITPAIPDIEMKAADWENTPYEKKTISEGIPDYITVKGEHVRSKSELMIANALHRHKIPYRYEAPIEIKGVTIHPDFSIFDKRTGKIIFWEHLGMMDDTYYRNDALKRMANYEASGIFSGHEIIYSCETGSSPLTPGAVEKKISKYLLESA